MSEAKEVLYMGDDSLQGAAAYLGGVLIHAGVDFSYVPSTRSAPLEFLDRSRGVIIVSDYPAKNLKGEAQAGIVASVERGASLLMIGGWESFHGLGEKSKESLRRIVRMELARWRKLQLREVTKMRKSILLPLLLIVSIPAFDAILPAHNLLCAEGEENPNRGQAVQSRNDSYQPAVTDGESIEGRREKLSFTGDSKLFESKRVEVGLGLGSLLLGSGCEVPIATLASVGFYVVRDVVQLEANMASVCGAMIISGNVSFNFPTEQRVVPFGTIGLGAVQLLAPILNVGGGVKIRLTDRVSIRTEYRHWIWSDGGLGSIFGGVSFFF